MIVRGFGNLVLVAVIISVGGALTRAQSADPVAFATVVTGGGALRVGAGEPSRVSPTSFHPEENGLSVGQALATAKDGTAVVVLPDSGASVHLQASSEIRFEPAPEWLAPDSCVLKVMRGRVTAARKNREAESLAVVGKNGGAVGSVAITEGIVHIVAQEGVVTFTVERGTASFVPGDLSNTRPDAVAGRVQLTAGESISTAAPATVAPGDDDAVAELSALVQRSVYAFGLTQSTRWVERAESGDFTPVRAGEGRAAIELVGADFNAPQTFDQPQQLLAVTSTLGAPVTSLRTVVSPAQGLLESTVPGSVIAGQRFRRSIIIGNPGTGGLMINPNAELLIRLAGQ